MFWENQLALRTSPLLVSVPLTLVLNTRPAVALVRLACHTSMHASFYYASTRPLIKCIGSLSPHLASSMYCRHTALTPVVTNDLQPRLTTLHLPHSSTRHLMQFAATSSHQTFLMGPVGLRQELADFPTGSSSWSGRFSDTPHTASDVISLYLVHCTCYYSSVFIQFTRYCVSALQFLDFCIHIDEQHTHSYVPAHFCYVAPSGLCLFFFSLWGLLQCLLVVLSLFGFFLCSLLEQTADTFIVVQQSLLFYFLINFINFSLYSFRPCFRI